MAAVLGPESSLDGAPRTAGALIALGLHAVLGAALMTYEPARAALFAAAPIMVELITPPQPQVKPEPVEIVPPKPKPRPKPKPKVKPKPVVEPQPKPPEPKPLIAAPVPVPSPAFTAPPPPAPAPAPEPPPAPAVVAAVPVPVVALTPPRFDARYLNNPPPAYPALSRRLGEEGRVVLRVLVDASGSADEVVIRDSSGHERLDGAARDTVRRWRFVPAKRGEQPIAAWVLIPISFKLEG